MNHLLEIRQDLIEILIHVGVIAFIGGMFLFFKYYPFKKKKAKVIDMKLDDYEDALSK